MSDYRPNEEPSDPEEFAVMYQREAETLRKRVAKLEPALRQSIAAMNAATLALKEALPYLEVSIGAEVLAWVNGYSGGINIEDVIEEARKALAGDDNGR
jgi:peptidoglycan/xylan/chitin deacetylase (PgdA/CDA1 family)